ncbi:7TM diverse intracellular signaling domain-containing protein [Magnetococcus sp. PR-3]|uniref:7TM diverse intracellular signaling domain-containing protein n=1 Tax=Magnetococcus sp. PR-3 TaxID=3120355 RepID=UPI002FCE687F
MATLRYLGLLILFGLISGPLLAHNGPDTKLRHAPIVLQPDTPHHRLQGHMQLLPAQPHPLTIDQVTQHAWVQQFKPIPWELAGGYQKQERWLRFHIERDAGSSKLWILEVGAAVLDDIELYYPDPKTGLYLKKSLGDHYPYAQRELGSRLHAAVVDMGQKQRMTVYLKLQTKQLMTFFGTLWQEQAFIENERRDNLIYGVYLGIFTLLIVVNTLFGYWTHDRALRIYALYLLSLALIQATTANLLVMLIPNAWPWFNDWVLTFALYAIVISINLLWSELLELKKYTTFFYKFYQYIVLFVALCMPLSLTPWFQIINPQIINLAFASFFLSMLLALYIAWRRRTYGIYLFYFLAFMPTTIGAVIYRMMLEGSISHNFWTQHAFQFGSLSHTILFTLVLAYRLRAIQQDRKHAQQEALTATQRAEAELEANVKQRSLELDAARISLESTHQQAVAAFQMERRIRRRQRTFLSLLSHEFRQPLSGIFRAVEMIRFKQPNLEPTIQAKLQEIGQESKQLGNWVDTLLIEHAQKNQEEDEEELLWDDEDEQEENGESIGDDEEAQTP